MTRRKLSLTRDQFASFLGDFEQIKQFELLFSTVDTIDALTLDEINISAGTANATANEALALISVLSDQTALLSLAPPDLGGTVTSVGLSGGTTGLTISGPNPITTSGTFIIGGTLGIANGGTGATTAADARVNLGAAASGANSDITSLSGITGGISSPDYIQFDTTAGVVVGQGQLAWNAADGTLDLGMGYDAVTQQIGLEQYFRIKASAAITNGQCVMFTGAVGSSGVLTGAPSTGITNGQYIMGVATMDIANNAFGYITSFGLVRGINTTGSSVGETWVDGDILYYNPNYAGGLTKVLPLDNQKIVVATVVNAGPGGSGSLFIRVQAEPELKGLSDVYAPSPISNGQILIGDGPQARWEATTLTPGSGVSITNAAGAITISATGSGGTVTSVSVVSANGFAGSVATATTTPAITLSTSVSGLVKGNGTALSAAIAGTDYVAPGAITTSGLTMATARILGRTTASTGAVEEITVGTGLSLSAGTLSNSAPDQTVSLAGGTGISISGTYPSFTITNTAPDQIVSLTGAGTTVVTGTYPSFTITSNDQYVGTVTSVSGTGTVNGITLTGTVTSTGSLTLGGTLSGVSLTSQVSGTLPIANGGTGSTSTTYCSLTTNVTGTLPVGNGGTGTATAFTSGSVVFAGASGVYTQDNANFFWDDTNNRLGIGNASPNAKVHITDQTNSAFTLNQYNDSEGALFRMYSARGTIASPTGLTTDSVLFSTRGFGYTSAGAFSGAVVQINAKAAQTFTSTAQGTYIQFSTTANGTTSASERVRIDQSGFVGINVTNPQQLLALGTTTDQVGAGVSGAVSTIYFGTPSNIAGGIKRIAYDRAAGTLKFIGGSVATPVTQMTLDGANNLLCPGVYSATVGATNRDVFVDNTGLIGYVPSILASKTNISDIADTSWLDALRPITFNYRKRDEDGVYTDEAETPLEYGLIAEEVEKINTELVFYDETEDGIELRGVSYRKLIIPLLKEVQSLRARVAALEGE